VQRRDVGGAVGGDPLCLREQVRAVQPAREERELVPALDTIAAFAFGGDPRAARALGGRFAGDRSSDAAEMLASLDD